MVSANEMGKRSWKKRVEKYGEDEAMKQLHKRLEKGRKNRIDKLKSVKRLTSSEKSV